MTIFPKLLSEYRNYNTSFPFTIAIHHVRGHFPSHRHDFIELSLVIDGSGSEIVNGVVHPMRPGTFTFLLPYQVHEIVADPGSPLRLYNCMLSLELLLTANDTDGGLRRLLFDDDGGRPAYVQFAPPLQDRMQSLMQEIHDEFAANHPWRNVLIRAKLTEALVRFDRERAAQSAETGQPEPLRGAAASGVWQVIAYIHAHYRDNVTLSGLAEQFHFHATHLSELIKKHTGQNFVALLNEIRLRHACALLASTEMTVADIAYEVGYGSSQTLFRVFQKVKGVSPRTYRLARNN